MTNFCVKNKHGEFGRKRKNKMSDKIMSKKEAIANRNEHGGDPMLVASHNAALDKIKEMKADIRIRNTTISRQKKEIEQLGKAINERIHAAETAVETIKFQALDIYNENETLSMELETKNERIEYLHEERDENNERMEELQSKYDGLKERARLLEGELEEAERDAVRLRRLIPDKFDASRKYTETELRNILLNAGNILASLGFRNMMIADHPSKNMLGFKIEEDGDFVWWSFNEPIEAPVRGRCIAVESGEGVFWTGLHWPFYSAGEIVNGSLKVTNGTTVLYFDKWRDYRNEDHCSESWDRNTVVG